jgi:hypothetical protein
MPNPSRVRYNKKADAYVITTRSKAGVKPTWYDVSFIPGGIPEGYVVKMHYDLFYHTFLYTAGHAADRAFARPVGKSLTLQEAIEDVRAAWHKGWNV